MGWSLISFHLAFQLHEMERNQPWQPFRQPGLCGVGGTLCFLLTVTLVIAELSQSLAHLHLASLTQNLPHLHISLLLEAEVVSDSDPEDDPDPVDDYYYYSDPENDYDDGEDDDDVQGSGSDSDDDYMVVEI